MTESDVGDMFATLFAARGGPAGLSADIAVSLELTDEDAASGVTREVAFERTVPCMPCAGSGSATPGEVAAPCKACDGRGAQSRPLGFVVVQRPCEACRGRGAVIANPCSTCTGSGIVPVATTASVTVPPGTLPGTVMRLEGQGNALVDGTRGALVVWLVIGDPARSQLTDVQDAFTRMMIEPGVPRAIVRSPRERRAFTPPQILALVIGAVLLLLGLVR